MKSGTCAAWKSQGAAVKVEPVTYHTHTTQILTHIRTNAEGFVRGVESAQEGFSLHLNRHM